MIAAVKELGEGFIQMIQGHVACDEVFGLEAAIDDQLKGTAADGWGVMEGGFERDIAVMHTIGVEANFGASFGTAEEVDETSVAHHRDRKSVV